MLMVTLPPRPAPSRLPPVAVTLLHEKLNRTQRGGLLLAAGAIVLITV